jgi:hypothetical protein
MSQRGTGWGTGIGDPLKPRGGLYGCDR